MSTSWATSSPDLAPTGLFGLEIRLVTLRVVEVVVLAVDTSTGGPVVTEILGSRAKEGDCEIGDWGFFSPVADMAVVVVYVVVVAGIVCGGAAVGVGDDVVLFSVNAVSLVRGAADPGCDTEAAVLLGATGTAGLEALTVAVGSLDGLLAYSGMESAADTFKLGIEEGDLVDGDRVFTIASVVCIV